MLQLILQYLECPQYLRKRLFPRHAWLGFAGTLPPLAVPHHFTRPPTKVGDIREAAVFLRESKTVADIGAKTPIDVVNPPKMNLGDKGVRKTVSVKSLNPMKVEILKNTYLIRNKYWGYRTRFSNGLLSQILSEFKCLKIATSKNCPTLEYEEKRTLSESKDLAILFGSPTKGIQEILKVESKKIRDVADNCYSFIKFTGTRTIRLEEAIFIVLANIQK